MTDTLIREEMPVLVQLVDYCDRHLLPHDAQELIRFAEDYLSGFSAEMLQQQEIAQLYGAVYSSWQYTLRRHDAQDHSSEWRRNLAHQLEQQQLDHPQSNAYRDAFSAAYREQFTPAQAAADVRHLDTLGGGDDLELELYSVDEEQQPSLHLKLYRRQQPLVLSDVVPILENLGMRILGEHSFIVRRGDGQRYWIHDYSLSYCPSERQQTNALEVAEIKTSFETLFLKIWQGEVENDGFNQLAAGARLGWRDIALLRAYGRYIRQIRFGFSQQFMADTLSGQVVITRQLVALFHARFAADLQGAERQAEGLVTAITDALDSVQSLDEDKILRRFLELILATLRTNYFQLDADGQHKSYFSFKFDPGAISELPQPRPKFEIFVYSSRVEGVHLRAGHVARGGLRWSDRSEDYRTEVLGLVKAQQVKNSVIVPMGAKGCFIAKQLPTNGNPEQLHAEGIACYQIYIRGLLDITDNMVAGAVMPPVDVVRHDDDDPYLVVAADKGTATFSDTANAIAGEYGFWLGDAFASGGSDGYDHKKMGITARGAWESVKRHFRERDLNSQSDPFTVVGIGDMGGDVFGNGMLLSKSLQLVAAFNHRHIFIDPDPDPARAYAERQRLFALPRCTWSDYQQELISAGGGIFSRDAKWIEISPAMQRRFDISANRLTPEELIKELLKSPVDMIWNGGIGTYVKAAGESHSDVGDKANDNLRIDGAQLRCKILGEGGNLGFTQRGRIEFSLNGGAVNTDFIDNAGGVDCSDHEVNIKILLNQQVAIGTITLAQRNTLLRDMTDEVSRLVLTNNARQVQALSLAQQHAQGALDEYIHLIDSMEKAGKLDRALEFLPTRKELIERKKQGRGLTRPELSVLMSYTKNELKQALIGSWLIEDPVLAREMERVFPHQLVDKFPKALHQHPLRQEIIATQLANDLVNRMGITYFYYQQQATGASPAQIAAAYLVAREVFGIRVRWRAIESLEHRVAADVQHNMLTELSRLMGRASRWLLCRRRNELNISDCIADYRDGIEQTVGSIERLQQVIPPQDRWHAKYQAFTQAGAPSLLSAFVAASQGLYWLLDIIEAAGEAGRELGEVSLLYFQLGERLNLPWLDQQIRNFEASSHWQALACTGFRDDLDIQHRRLTTSALRDCPNTPSAQAVIDAWMSKHGAFMERWHGLFTGIQGTKVTDCAVFSVSLNMLLEIR